MPLTGAVIALGTATSGSGAAPYTDAYTAWVLPSYFATDYQDVFENGASCVGTYTPLSIGELQTSFGTFSDVVLVQREFDCGGFTTTLYQWYPQNDVINILAEYNTGTQLVTLNIPTGFSPVGIEEHRAAQARLYPNPAAVSPVRISGLEPNARMQVELIALDGRTASHQYVSTTNAGMLLLDIGNAANGAYTVQLTNGASPALRLPLVINR